MCSLSLVFSSIHHDCIKAAVSNIQINEHGCVPTRLYLWMWKIEFHILFMCHKVLFFLWFFSNHVKMQKPFLAYGSARQWARLGLQAVLCWFLLSAVTGKKTLPGSYIFLEVPFLERKCKCKFTSRNVKRRGWWVLTCVCTHIPPQSTQKTLRSPPKSALMPLRSPLPDLFSFTINHGSLF